MSLEHPDLRVLHRVDRLAVDDHLARADRNGRARLRQLRVAADVDLVAHELVVRADLADELDLPSRRARGRRPSRRAPRRRSRSAARSRPRRGSRAAPGPSGSGTERTRRPPARRTRRRSVPAARDGRSSTTRSTISIGGPGRVGIPSGRRIFHERAPGGRQELRLRELRCAAGTRRTSRRTLLTSISNPPHVRPDPTTTSAISQQDGRLVPALREHAGRARGAAVAELGDVGQVVLGQRCRRARTPSSASSGSPDGR